MICSRNFLKQLHPFSDSFLWGSPTRVKNRLIGGHAQMSWSMQIRGCLGTSMTVNVWRSYMWTADKEVNMKAIFAAMNTIYTVVKNKAWKKILACTGFEPIPSAIRMQCSKNWADKPTGSWSWCNAGLHKTCETLPKKH